ncbi:HD domain-containing protein [Paenibacillus hamazuiensis]|uniref:HD domain-containing protein n=1 Tax=Paenibacillus hamazuiensis TaxID=2936508 RepID=UPI002010592C|nr:HD domain-containing protein [Paenibacillus hamazuiensis]
MAQVRYPFVRIDLPEWIVPLVARVYEKMRHDATGHDFHHAVRVMEFGADLARRLGADEELLLAAGLLHDYYRIEEKQTGRLHYGPEAMQQMRHEFGAELGSVIGEIRLERLLEAISLHERYDFCGEDAGAVPAGNSPDYSLEAKILQDTDRLEAIGAMGIARAFMFSGAHGLPMFEELGATSALFDPGERPKGSTYRHFHEKLLRLCGCMHTEPARRMALERHRFMLLFLRQWEEELDRENDMRKMNDM